MASVFLDTYALYEIVVGNPQYAKWMHANAATTRLQLMELYYRLLESYGEDAAEKYHSFFSKFIVEFDDDLMKKAMHFRLTHKTSRFSYIDCIGYVMAAKLDARFLTGDSAFKGMPNVEYVK